ncbi:MAG TPA: DNA alkylation repair protein [Hyphomonadaceae bacterium]|nr:DNA alkylation repair protein [Hyphomonadaceae bacterium]
MTPAERDRLVREAVAKLYAVKVRTTPNLRIVRREISAKLKGAPTQDVKAVSLALVTAGWRWIGYEVVNVHRGALDALTAKEVEAFSQGMAGWVDVDTFGILISGPAWLRGRIGDHQVMRWARSPDLWRRRAALVSTVGLNGKTRGGIGDTKRTMLICKILVADHEDMVVKAMSWALRSLTPWDPKAVKAFLAEHEAALAARVKREVRNKLKTGLKNPKAPAR